MASNLHAVLVPIPSQSHLIPMSSLSFLLARRGLVVTVLLNPSSALPFYPILSSHPSLSINLSFLPSPSSSDPTLPHGCDTIDSLLSPELRTRFLLACNSLRQPVLSVLRTLTPPPSFIVSSFLWTSDLAAELRIPRFNFGTVSCFTLFATHQLQAHNLIANSNTDSDPFLVPGLPHRVEFTNAQLPIMLRREEKKCVRDHFARSMDCSDGILMNTIEELEPDYCRLYREGKDNVFCIGPLSIVNTKDSDDHRKERHHCLNWLDSMEDPKSVIYICFGSLARMSSKQMIEIGVGLRRSNRPFIWVVQEADYSKEFEDWVDSESGFNGILGMVVRKWAPQVDILSRVGGFLTHCGWNSVLEGVFAGVPMVTWPMFAEQFFNEKMVVDVLGIGVRVGVEASVDCVGGGDGAFVGREKVERAVEELMGGGGEGDGRRRRAEELGKAARAAVEEGGSSELNMALFIEHVKKKLEERGSA